MHTNDILAAQGLRNATVVDRDDTRDFATRHPAAGGLVETTLSSRRQRDGLRQRDYLGFIGSSGVNLWEVYAALAWVSDASVLFPVLL